LILEHKFRSASVQLISLLSALDAGRGLVESQGFLREEDLRFMVRFSFLDQGSAQIDLPGGVSPVHFRAETRILSEQLSESHLLDLEEGADIFERALESTVVDQCIQLLVGEGDFLGARTWGARVIWSI
jgi:hypothetical protein